MQLGREGQVPAVPSIICFCFLASARLLWPLPPPLLPVVGLLFPITKLLAEVGKKQVFSEGVTRWGVQSRGQPIVTSSVAQGSGLSSRVSPSGNPPTAPQTAARSLLSSGGSVWGWAPKHTGMALSNSVVGWIAALSLLF